MNRTKFAIKNIAWGYLSKIINVLLTFGSRSLFLFYLSEEYLGLSGLLLSLVGMLSVVDLGVGSAMGFALYEPIAKKDTQKTSTYLALFQKIYHWIAISIFVIGLGLIPFLDQIVDVSFVSKSELCLYYLLYLVNTACSYLVVYQFVYIHAIQKSYIVTLYHTVVDVAVKAAQVIVLICFHSFLAYLLIQIIVLLASRVAIKIYLQRHEPYLQAKTTQKLAKAEKDSLVKNIKAMFVSKVSAIAITSVDNLLLASITGIGLVIIARIANYNLLITSVLSFVSILFGYFSGGFGNMYVTESQESVYNLYQEINFIHFWLNGFCFIAFWILIEPFITLWLGADFLIEKSYFFLILINQLLTSLIMPLGTVRMSKGEYHRDRYVNLLKATLNVGISIVALHYLGVIGIFLGTFVSVLIGDVIEILVIYRFLFAKPCREYFVTNAYYLFVLAIAMLVTTMVCSFLLETLTLGSFALCMVAVTLIPNAVFLLLFWKLPQYQRAMARIKKILKR